jgi:hypothetical protein
MAIIRTANAPNRVGPVSKQVNRPDRIPIRISPDAAVWTALQLAKCPENMESKSSPSFRAAVNATYRPGCLQILEPKAALSTIFSETPGKAYAHNLKRKFSANLLVATPDAMTGVERSHSP